MKSGLKYTQSFGKCNEQDMTFRIPCAQRAAIPVQDGSTVRSALTSASSLCEPACGSSAWPFSPRYRAAYRRQERLYAQAAAPESSKRSGTAENDRCRCTVWPSSSRKMEHIFVSLSFMRTEAFFTPPGRFACPAFGYSRSVWHIAGCRCERKERGIKK